MHPADPDDKKRGAPEEFGGDLGSLAGPDDALSGYWDASDGHEPEPASGSAAPTVPGIAAHRYEDGPVLGRGGMGEVRAVRDTLLERVVAQKQVLETSAGQTARLRREARITARLEHPGIVPIYDLGQTDSGPAYTMRMVRGDSLAARLEDATATDRLKLLRHLRDACEAVAYAHSMGVVHRDLKPANIMVGHFGETLVVDWGLALEESAPRAEGAVVGTPGYMPPEQARGSRETPRSDIYSLGRCLQELLGDGPPRALSAIVERATAVEPDDRYTDAKALADDLTAWLEGRRVDAHVYGLTELVRLFIARHRTATVVALTALVILAAFGAWAFHENALERDRARAAAARSDAQARRADRNLGRVLGESARRADARGATPEAAVLAAHALALLDDDPIARGVLAGVTGTEGVQLNSRVGTPSCTRHILTAQGLVCIRADRVELYDPGTMAKRWSSPGSGSHPTAAGDTIVLRRPPGLVFLDAATGTTRHEVADEFGPLQGLEGAPDRVLVVERSANAVYLVDGRGRGASLLECETTVPAAAMARGGRGLVACPDGRLFRIIDGDFRSLGALPAGHATSWRGRPRVLPDPREPVAQLSDVALAPSAGVALIGTWKGELLTVSLSSGEVRVRAVTGAGPVRDIVVSEDQRMAIVLSESGGPLLWNLEQRRWVSRLPQQPIETAAWDAKTIVTAGPELTRWRLVPGPPGLLDAQTGLTAVALSADERWLAATGSSGLTVWDHQTGQAVAHWDTDGEVLKGVAILEDPVEVISTPNGAGQAWRGRPGDWANAGLWGPAPRGRRIATQRGGVLTLATYGAVTRIDRKDLSGLRFAGSPGPAIDLDGRPDSRYVHAALQDEWVARVPGDFEAAWERLFELQGVLAVAASNDGDRVAAASADAVELRLEPELSGEPYLQLRAAQPVVDIAMSPDGGLLAIGELTGGLAVHDTRDGTLRLRMTAHDERISTLTFVADGNALYSGSWDRRIRRWDLSVLAGNDQDRLKDIEQRWGLSRDEAMP